MEMETLLHSNNTITLDLVASLVAETALCAQKSLLCLLLMIGSESNGGHMLTSLMEADQRFPFADLTSVREPVADNKDAGETDVTESSSDDDEEDLEEEEDNESEEEESDDGEDSDDDAEAHGDSESDEDDDDNDEDDDSDDDEEDNDEDEDDDEEEQPPPKKKK